MLKPGVFERCLVSWVTALHTALASRLVGIDGEALRQGSDEATAMPA